MPGQSLMRIAQGNQPKRIAFSEYHAFGSSAAFYMIRDGHWKYTHYIDAEPELFDLHSDPHETNNLGSKATHKQVINECEAKLREIVDPEAVNRQAFADQQVMIEKNGGVEAIKARAEIGYSPTPS